MGKDVAGKNVDESRAAMMRALEHSARAASVMEIISRQLRALPHVLAALERGRGRTGSDALMSRARMGRAEATAKGWAMVSVDFREPDVHTESEANGYCACGKPYSTLRDRDDACCLRCREAKAPAYRALLVSSLEAEQREMPVNAFDRRAASEAWSAGVRASVARLEEEKRAADARRLGWDPELTGGDE